MTNFHALEHYAQALEDAKHPKKKSIELIRKKAEKLKDIPELGIQFIIENYCNRN